MCIPRRAGALALAVALALGPSAPAAYEFATFHPVTASGPFALTNNGGTSLTIGAANVPVTFNWAAATGLSTADHGAYLSIGPIVPPSSTQPASVAGPFVTQPVNDLEKLTLTSGVNGTGQNLLTLFFTGDISGLLGGSSASLVGADDSLTSPRIVAYTSDFGTFVAPGNSYNLGLDTITPALSVGPGGFLGSFDANVGGTFTGTFQATPAASAAPEPASLTLLATGALGLLGYAWRKRRQPA